MGWGGHQAEHLIYREASQTSNLQPPLPRKKTHQIYINPRNTLWQQWSGHVPPQSPPPWRRPCVCSSGIYTLWARVPCGQGGRGNCTAWTVLFKNRTADADAILRRPRLVFVRRTVGALAATIAAGDILCFSVVDKSCDTWRTYEYVYGTARSLAAQTKPAWIVNQRAS